MKQATKQTIKRAVALGACVLMLALLLVSVLPARAAEGLHVSVRIEGAVKTYYSGDVLLAAGDSAMQAVVAAANAASISLTGADSGYISAVADEAAGAFGGWDGWMYRVNGKDQPVGLGDYTLADGDAVVLFYGGYPTQFPQMTAEGSVLTFVSEDLTYDENFNATPVIAPIVGATVTVGERTFVTDEKGQVDIAELADATYPVQIEKKDASGAPVVVRMEKAFVTLKRTTESTETTATETAAAASTTEPSSAEIVTTAKETTTAPAANVTTAAPTASAITAGEGHHVVGLCVVIVAALAALCVLCRRRNHDED